MLRHEREKADDSRLELLRIAVQAPLQCFPKEHVGKRVTILFDADMVEIYCDMNLVTIHGRCDIPYTYSWKKEYNLLGHYGPYDKDLEELFRCASEIDNIVLNYLPGSGAAHAVSSKSVQILPGHTFSRKITQIRGTIDKKRQKEAFVGIR